MSANLDFWTSKNYLPYQTHNFEVEMVLYAIKSEKFFEVDPEVSPGIQNVISNNVITGADVERIRIPPHAIKSIDLPTLEVGLDDISGNLSEISTSEGRDPNYQSITITFYAVDTEYGNIINLLPRIFHAYYLNFVDTDASPVPISRIPFQTNFDKDAPGPNAGYALRSTINVELFRGSSVGNFRFTENPDPNGRTFREPGAGTKDQRSSDDRRNIVYSALAPISFDLGQLAYTENGILECTMVFDYNIPFTDKDRSTEPGDPNDSGEDDDEPVD